MPLEAEEDYLLSSWLDSEWAHLVHFEEIFNSELELLTPLWQAVLGSQLLDDGSRCSTMVHATRQLLTTAWQLIMVVGP